MRFLHAVLFVSLVACASGPRPVNVAAVRSEIKDSISDRRIVSMGHTENDKAVVFTETPDKARHEEMWVRSPQGWKLESSTAVSSN